MLECCNNVFRHHLSSWIIFSFLFVLLCILCCSLGYLLSQHTQCITPSLSLTLHKWCLSLISQEIFFLLNNSCLTFANVSSLHCLLLPSSFNTFIVSSIFFGISCLLSLLWKQLLHTLQASPTFLKRLICNPFHG